jgi:Na+-transporting methylmalonyl-CoA/oxaloacetate decarboxylase beta subunit
MVLMFAAGATGVMLGLWFRVQALIAASAATVLSFLLIAAFTDFGVLAAAGTLLLLLSLLQAGYLAGLMVAHAWSRTGFARSGYDHEQGTVARALDSGARAR